MPSWKKVITSGSDAHLNNITASGEISASGTIRTSRLRVDNHIIAVDSSGDIGLLYDDSGIKNIKIGRSGAHITASGNISGSSTSTLTLGGDITTDSTIVLQLLET